MQLPRLLLVLAALTTGAACSAPRSSSPPSDSQIVGKRDNVTYSASRRWYRSDDVVDSAAEPVGGMSAFAAHLDYPRELRRRWAHGKVRVEVALDARGDIKHARIIQSGGSDFDAIVLRAVRSVKWKPAIRHGKPVPFTFTFPVSFVRPKT
jgi:TonB family protein